MPHLVKRTLATRLGLTVVAFGSAIVIVGSALSYRTSASALRERLLTQLAAEADDGALRLSEWLIRQRDAVVVEAQALAQPGARRPVRPDSVALGTLPRNLLTTEELQLIAVPGGQVLRSTTRASVGTFAVDELYYREGRRAPYVQTIYYSGVTGRPRLTIAAPVRTSAADSTVALVAAHLDLSQMEAVLGRPLARDIDQQGDTTTSQAEAYLVNRFAEFVSARRFGRQGVQRGVHSPAIEAAIAGGRGTALYTNYAGTEVVGSWRWIPELELALIVETPQEQAFAPARRLLFTTLLLGIAAMTALTFGVGFITRRFADPVVQVANAATRVAAGDFSVTAPEDRRDEVGQLGRAFNVMTTRLQSLYERLESQVAVTQNALDEAQASRELLQDLLNNSATLVLVVDLAHRVRLANVRAEALTGVSASAAVGQTVDALFGAGAHALRELLARAQQSAAVVEREIELGASGGTHGWQVVAFPLRHEDGSTYALGLIGTDLTERARAEADRRALDATVQQAQKLESLGVMAGGIAHDFNNILGAILGNVDLAREALDDHSVANREVASALDRIGVAGRRAAELTRQMLAYAGRATLKLETVDVRKVIDDIVPIVQAAHSKKVRLVVDVMPNPLLVDCDPAQLSQVLLNLLTNAAEAIGEGSGVVTVRARPGHPPSVEARDTAREMAWMHLSVEDTGPGIPDAMRANIFDPFFSTKASGRGLGLSAVRGIVRSLGGVLELVSTDGAGTRFDIYLRASDAGAVSAPAMAAGMPRRLQGTLLVVDDEAPIRSIVTRVATRMGLSVLEADDGESGLRAFHQHSGTLSAVLLDLTMPGMGGGEVLIALRRTHPTLPVIVVSGYDADDAMATIGSDPATVFLAKPFSTDALRRLLDEACAGQAPASGTERMTAASVRAMGQRIAE